MLNLGSRLATLKDRYVEKEKAEDVSRDEEAIQNKFRSDLAAAQDEVRKLIRLHNAFEFITNEEKYVA